MARKKKQFIVKKNAAMFSIVHRSQRDPLYHDDNASKMVLLPISQKGYTGTSSIPEEAMFKATKGDRLGVDFEESEEEEEDEYEEEDEDEEEEEGLRLLGDKVDTYGLPLDGYDYSQHMREIGREGMVLDARGLPLKREDDIMARKVGGNIGLPDDLFQSLQEEDRMLEAIAIDDSMLDPEIRQALGGWGDFEELQDDFIMAAMEEKEGDEEDNTFDFDAHVARLMKAAERNETVRHKKGEMYDDDDDFNNTNCKGKSVRFEDEEDEEEYDDDDDENNNINNNPQRKQRLVDEQFATLMESYGDGEIGEGEEDEDNMGGTLTTDDEFLLSMMDEYIVKRKKEKEIVRYEIGEEEEKEKKLINKNMIEIIEKEMEEEGDEEEEIDESNDTIQEKEKENDVVVEVIDGEEDEDDEDAEEDEEEQKDKFVGKIDMNNPSARWLNPSMFAKEKTWDCETVISTYTNTENHPSVIFDMGRKKNKDNEVMNSNKIILSNKTGLPIRNINKNEKEEDDSGSGDVEEKDEEEDDGDDLVMEIPFASNKRRKEETKEEKKERKLAIKNQRAVKRELKKDLKLKYKNETAKAKVNNPVDTDITARVGQPIFKY